MGEDDTRPPRSRHRAEDTPLRGEDDEESEEDEAEGGGETLPSTMPRRCSLCLLLPAGDSGGTLNASDTAQDDTSRRRLSEALCGILQLGSTDALRAFGGNSPVVRRSESEGGGCRLQYAHQKMLSGREIRLFGDRADGG